MISKRLETFLAIASAKVDISQRSPADMVQRFQALRGYGLLPKGRGKNAQHLSPTQIVAGILSIIPVKPGFAGLVSKVLMNLRPVGGVNASFKQCPTFGKALEAILEAPDALDSIIAIRASDSEVGINSNGFAIIEYTAGEARMTAYYIGSTARSVLQPGAEKTFDLTKSGILMLNELVFHAQFIKKLRRELQRNTPELTVLSAADLEEDDEEIRQEERAKRLGLRAGSHFLNVGVDNQVTWPRTETVVEFEGYKLILLPKTREHTTSVHIDLHSQKLSSEDARTLINRFLSLMTWCDDQYAVMQEGWSGNPVPVAVPKRDLAFTTAYHWAFNRKIPQSPIARKALAIYRQGRIAEQNFLESYAVLSYYKIIELKHKGKEGTKKWLRDNFAAMKQANTDSETVAAFEKDCGTEKPHEYLHTACRVAVAHASEKTPPSDPDDLHEIRRLHIAASILQSLARRFIQDELQVSDCLYDGS
jgi:hypothetical protein